MDFLWHEVSEKEKKEIKEEAKSIMDSFSEKLSKIDKKISESLIEREEYEREEGESNERDSEFKKIMFENAPNKNKDFIIAEKKKW
jgi:Asp-tRNA(Asn)/Glu-tRNA(Gln) amidotransferase C subunit|tara:strand:- start:882 stop:1139 length:258 start_codon:yes stop_codon:yes gene_type:complete